MRIIWLSSTHIHSRGTWRLAGWSLQELQVDGRTWYHHDSKYWLHFSPLGVISDLKLPDDPSQSQVHLQLGNTSPNTGPNPIAKRNGAEWMAIRPAIAQPPLGQEPVRILKIVLVSGDGIMIQNKQSFFWKAIVTNHDLLFTDHSAVDSRDRIQP